LIAAERGQRRNVINIRNNEMTERARGMHTHTMECVGLVSAERVENKYALAIKKANKNLTANLESENI
jgi:hypothetical protein